MNPVSHNGRRLSPLLLILRAALFVPGVVLRWIDATDPPPNFHTTDPAELRNKNRNTAGNGYYLVTAFDQFNPQPELKKNPGWISDRCGKGWLYPVRPASPVNL